MVPWLRLQGCFFHALSMLQSFAKLPPKRVDNKEVLDMRWCAHVKGHVRLFSLMHGSVFTLCTQTPQFVAMVCSIFFQMIFEGLKDSRKWNSFHNCMFPLQSMRTYWCEQSPNMYTGSKTPSIIPTLLLMATCLALPAWMIGARLELRVWMRGQKHLRVWLGSAIWEWLSFWQDFQLNFC